MSGPSMVPAAAATKPHKSALEQQYMYQTHSELGAHPRDKRN
jgi:hypothetical protein